MRVRLTVEERIALVLTLLACARVLGAEAPAITAQPQSRTNVAGTDASFTVTATGTEPLAYQWTLALELIAGATASSYTATNVQVMGEPASYQVVITNASGSVTSEVAYLTVTEPGEPEPDTNYYAAVSGLPKMNVGGQQVSMMVKADKFLPLVLAKSTAALIVGLTNDDLAIAGITALYPWGNLGWGQSNCGKTNNMPYEMITNTVWSNSFVFKGCAGVGSCVQGWYSNTDVCIDSQLMNRGVLITRRHFLTQGHICTPKAGVLARFVGTNNEVHLVKIKQTVCGNWALGVNPGADYIITNTSPPDTFALAQFEEDVPGDVEICKVWPTNGWRYISSDRTAYRWLQVHTCQDNLYTVRLSTEVYWSGLKLANNSELTMKDLCDDSALPNNLRSCYLGVRRGDSGSPYYSILGNEMFGGVYTACKFRVPIEATIQYLWTNNGGSIETCPTLTEVDLSGYARLR